MRRSQPRVLLRYQFLVISYRQENKNDQSQKFGGRTITGGSSSSGIGRGTRRTRRCEITGASSMLGTGGVTIVSPKVIAEPSFHWRWYRQTWPIRTQREAAAAAGARKIWPGVSAVLL